MIDAPSVDTNAIASFLITVIAVVAILAGLAFGGYKLFQNFLKNIKEASALKKSLGLTVFEVKLPRENEIEIKAADQMFTGLTGIGKKLKRLQKYLDAQVFVSFEVVAFKDNIRFFVVCPDKIANLVDRQINGNYPEAEINKVKEYNLFPDDASVAFAALKLDKEDRLPVRTYEELPVDPLATLLDAFSKLQPNEAAAYQVVITPAGSEWRNQSKDYIRKIKEKMSDPDNKGKVKVNEDTLEMVDVKASKSGFKTDVRIVVVSDLEGSANAHLSNILSTFDQFTREGGNRFKKVDKKKLKKITKDFVYRLPRESMVLNTSELATLIHFPNKLITTPHIQWLLSSKAPAADFVTSSYQQDYMYLGRNVFRGKNKEIFIKPDDRLRHMYIIGQTGSGKSYFMSSMMIRDIKMGHGCAYIDPHGTDVERIMEQIPPERVEDVVIFDPADLERPIGLNMLEFNTEAEKTLVINEMLNIFDTLYDLKKTGGPIFEQYMRYGILLLTADKESGSTLLEIPKIFADDGYRAYKLSKCDDQEVIDFWKKQAEKAGGEASLKNMTPYITSKLASFLSNAYVRPIVAQQDSTINFRNIMDDGKILLAKLSKGKIGDFNANLLGMILIGKLLVAGLGRESVAESQRKPFYLYIDEFQNFLTDGIMIILSEARKYKLSLTIGHQFIGQLTRAGGDTKIRDAIFGNVGNKAVFRVGVDDAEFLEKEFDGSFNRNDLIQVENRNAFLKMLVDGKPAPPFSALSMYDQSQFGMITSPNPELADIIKQISRLKYGKDRNIVENEAKMRGTFVKEEEKDKANPFGMPSFGF